MICESCKVGGKLLIEARALPVGQSHAMRNMAWLKHKQCESASCPCHHQIPRDRKDVINDRLS